jgi:hypothetical protein
MGPIDMAWFLWIEDGKGAAGSLTANAELYTPSQHGALVYFTAHSGDVSNELLRVEPAGGKVLLPKTEVAPGFGFKAVILDTEGNRIALHSKV